MEKQQLGILAIGAHPDDCDFQAGGVAALYARQGHRVRFVSLTNGDAGHHEMGGAALARRRRAETLAAAATLGIEYDVLDIHDGELVPSLEYRRAVIRLIRGFVPDLILAPRPYDYHPDHRYASILVQDAAYMVTVPGVAGLTGHLRLNPAVAYFSDDFHKPCPFTPDVVVAIDAVVEQKVEALHCHASQVYEWLPYNALYLDQVPQDRSARRAWLRRQLDGQLRHDAERYRDRLIELYGPERAAAVRYAEAFEASEYGSPLTAESIQRLFPFFS
jgi:LmbE family N-acetylglucosaminyl deacetylase